jgi:uncharacterized protein YggE
MKSAKKVIALVAAAVMSLGVLTASAAASEPVSGKGSLVLNGVGKVKADPDMATISIGVDVTAAEAADAQKENAEIMDKVIAALKEKGLEDRDIQTQNYYMNKQYDYNNYDEMGQPREVGYQVSHVLDVTVTDIEKIGEILDAAVNAGANQTYGVNFTIANQEEYYLEALSMALENAKTKADALAKVLKVAISAPSSVVESSYQDIYPVYRDAGPFMNYSTAANQALSNDGAAIATGKVEVSANVTVTYEYDK